MFEISADAREKVQRFETFIAQDPNNVRLREDFADLLKSVGQPKQARTQLEAALHLKRNDEGLRFKLGQTCLDCGDAQKGYELFQGLLADGVTHPAVLYNKAYAAFNAGRAAEACDVLDEIDPSLRAQLPQFGFLRARALYFSGANDKALAEITRFAGEHPGDLDAMGLHAQILEDSGDLASGSALAQAVLVQRPADPVANLVAGEIAMFGQQPDVAEPYLRRVVECAPTIGRAWSALGFVAIERRQTDLAIEQFKKAVQHMPNHLGTWHGLAWCQILRGDLVGAHQSIDRAMQVERTFADNHGTLAVILFMQGKVDEARQSAKRGMRLNPKSAASLFAQSLVSSEWNDKAGQQRAMARIFEGRKLPDGSSVEQAIARHLAQMTQPANNVRH